LILRALAPAKVNLFLHVGPLAPDGFHPLVSWMAFADVGDALTLEPSDEPAFRVTGPFAGALADEDPGKNLAWRAARRLLEKVSVEAPCFTLTLDKRLPVAAGLGGGSSDAGAALRLVRHAFAPDAPDSLLNEVAAELGSDGPACLFARPVLAEGRGERLSPAPETPPLPAVLVNPGVPCPTGPVYRAYDAEPGAGRADYPELPASTGLDGALSLLAGCRNDLEAPAISVAPLIAEVLEWLRGRPETLLARLSGSGATCFALCGDAAGARALAEAVQAAEPGWWVRPCRLGGPWS